MNSSKLLLVKDFLLAAIVSFVLASISHTQFVLFELSKVGVEIDVGTRISAILQDLVGFLPAFAPVITIGLLIGFSLVTWLRKRYKLRFRWLYPLAGAVTLLSIHALMHPILEITLIAGARSVAGLIMQMVAGFAGGAIFYTVRKKHLPNV